MNEKHSVTLQKIIEEFHLQVVYGQEYVPEILITSNEINRPGLQFAGYLDCFGPDRVQIAGKGEIEYLFTLPAEKRLEVLDRYFQAGVPCLVICRDLPVAEEFKIVSEKYHTPILTTASVTSDFLSGVIRYLNVELCMLHWWRCMAKVF